MKKKKKKLEKLPLRGILLGVLLALLAGVAGELLFNVTGLAEGGRNHPGTTIAADQVEVIGGEERDGVFVAKGDKMVLRIQFPWQYVNKFHYTYESPYINVTAKARVQIRDGYGREAQEELECKSSILRNLSVFHIRDEAGGVELTFEKPTDGLVVTGLGLNGGASFSKMRFLFFAMAGLLIYLLAVLRRTVTEHLERVFLLLALPVGLLMILGFSPREAGWDEHIHFYRAYSLMYDLTGQETMPVSEELYTYMNTGMANEPFYYPRSQEENGQERAYLERGKTSERIDRPTNGLHIYSLAYLPQTLFLAIGQLFSVPLWLLIALGRVGNLLCYCLLVWLALRHMKQGKGILFVIALFPTSVFLAATYSYDAFVNGCLLLGLSYFFTELLERDRPVSGRNLAVFAAAVIVGSMPKAVYIPIILLGLLIPARRFPEKKWKWIFWSVLFVALLALLATFVMPATGDPQSVTDARGGDTNAGEQLALVLGHPIAYLRLALGAIWETLFSYLFTSSVAGNLAYRGGLYLAQWICPFLLFVVLADPKGGWKKELGAVRRISFGVLLLGVIGLIWTALYLSYTPVGAAQINGVQARYYIPLLLPIYLWAAPERVKSDIPAGIYHRILSGGSLVFLLDGLWHGVIRACF